MTLASFEIAQHNDNESKKKSDKDERFTYFNKDAFIRQLSIYIGIVPFKLQDVCFERMANGCTPMDSQVFLNPVYATIQTNGYFCNNSYTKNPEPIRKGSVRDSTNAPAKTSSTSKEQLGNQDNIHANENNVNEKALYHIDVSIHTTNVECNLSLLQLQCLRDALYMHEYESKRYQFSKQLWSEAGVNARLAMHRQSTHTQDSHFFPKTDKPG
jgi:hypothetical protein